jgi:hypothetical protein
MVVSDLVRKYKRSRDTIRDWIQLENVKGRQRTESAIARGPKSNQNCKPLTPLHKKIGYHVRTWRNKQRDTTPKTAAVTLGYSVFKYSQIELGICDMTLYEAIELVKTIQAEEIFNLCSLT